MNLEALLTSKAGFNLASATPLQRAIVRAAEGRPTGLPADQMVRYFGAPAVPQVPALIVLMCGVRSGKSLMAVCAALYSALTADLSKLLSHERARVAVVAPTVANASTTFRLLTGAILSSPALYSVVVGEPTSDTVTVRRPDGRYVDIVVVAAHRGAVTLRGTWLAGFILEEVAFFGADVTGYAVNAEELLRAAETRLVPKGQGWIISSPQSEDGLLYDLWRTHFGHPSRIMVVHAPTLAMNYVTVSKEMVEAVRKRDPDSAAREYDAIPISGASVLIPRQDIELCTRQDNLVLRYEKGLFYRAAMDPATRGNAWTLVVASRIKRDERLKQVIVYNREWIGSKINPLDPDLVIGEMAEILNEYGLNTAETDQWAADFIKSISRRHGLFLFDRTSTAAENSELFRSMAAKLSDGDIELPNDETLLADLRMIRRQAGTSLGAPTRIIIPRTPDGRHCDYAPALARVLASPVSEPKEAQPEPGDPGYERFMALQDKTEAMKWAERREKKTTKQMNKALRRGDYRGF